MVTAIKRVHVIFKTHLDIGFTDLAGAVTQRYIDEFIPKALDTAEQLRSRGRDRFIWTTGAWLIWEYLDRAGAPERARLERAIVAGDIAWHALPFTTHSELADADLFAFGISMARDLDARFGRRTIAAKMTDVPGHTRSIVPILSAAGVKLLHIGVNAASHPPDVPDTFVWRDPTGSELIVLYQRGGYGDLSIVPGVSDALAFAHTEDNLGPQSAEAALAHFAALRERFPGADVRASTLDAFAEALLAAHPDLPVVDGEIGDTWIHGAGSDPGKISRFRELSRLRRAWLEHGQVAPDDPAIAAFSRNLLLVAEHTWGLDEKTHLADYVNYTREQLQAARATPAFRRFESSWAEQRAYLDTAMSAIHALPVANEARAHLAALTARQPDWSHLAALPASDRFAVGHAIVAWSADAITLHLNDQAVALLPFYQTFSEQDYDRFRREYNVNHEATARWAIDDYSKPGMEAAGARSARWLPEMVEAFHSIEQKSLVFRLTMPYDASSRLGCPRLFTLELTPAVGGDGVEVVLQWFDKAASRLPEALWFKVAVEGARATGWAMRKMDRWIDPLSVVRHGNRHLHAVEAVRYTTGATTVQVDTLDAALVAPGEPALLSFPDDQPDPSAGMHFNLYNNAWGTNFAMWYDEDARFRFVVRAA